MFEFVEGDFGLAVEYDVEDENEVADAVNDADSNLLVDENDVVEIVVVVVELVALEEVVEEITEGEAEGRLEEIAEEIDSSVEDAVDNFE